MALIVFRGKPGEELGHRFRLLAELGKEFGEVWQARRLKDGATVAIKIPKDQEKGEEVLRKESDIIRDIHHPNIVRVHGFHNISELFMIEMEFVDGYDLAKVLDSVEQRWCCSPSNRCWSGHCRSSTVLLPSTPRTSRTTT